MQLLSATNQNSTQQISLALKQIDLNAQTFNAMKEHLTHVTKTNELVTTQIELNK